MTAEELLRYRHEPYQQELIDGILYEMEPPGALHGAVDDRDRRPPARSMSEPRARSRVHRRGGLPAGRAIRTPCGRPTSRSSLASASDEIGIPKGYWPGPPDLAVEVVSQHDRRIEGRGQGAALARRGHSRGRCRRSAAAAQPRSSAPATTSASCTPTSISTSATSCPAGRRESATSSSEAIACAAMPTIVTLPGDGIGPEIMAPALELLRTISEDFSFDEHLFGGAAIDVHGTALTDETLAACKARRRGPARRRRRPEVGHDRPRRAASRAGPARPAQGHGPVREPAPGAPGAARSTTRARSSASASRARTCSSSAS